MRLRIQNWHGRDYVHLSGEGRAGVDATAQSRDLFGRFDVALQGLGLSLDNTVRSRIIARDRQSRTDASDVRQQVLTGQKRAAGSSYIWPDRFDGQALSSIDLIAVRPSKANLVKTLVEYDPPINPVRYHVYDGMAYLSGVTSIESGPDNQVADIVPRLSESLAMAGSSWERVVRLSFFMHRSQEVDVLRQAFNDCAKAPNAQSEITFVDGFSAVEKLLEVETTALVG
jgi:enamine deaminase RidA (YjgF/YER057c/UK114 family)